MKKGFSIVVEGTDGSGKQTQVGLLEKRLISSGRDVESFSFPCYDTPTGRMIGQCYLGKDVDYYDWKGDSGWFGKADDVHWKIASTLYALDRLAAKPEIENALAQGKFVLLDRYRQSNMGHQAGKIRDSAERVKVVDWLDNYEVNVLGVHKEDDVLFLYTPWQVAQELKKKFSGETSEKLDMHEVDIEHIQRAEKAYLEVAERFGWKVIKCAPEGVMRTPKDIHEEVWNYVSERF